MKFPVAIIRQKIRQKKDSNICCPFDYIMDYDDDTKRLFHIITKNKKH